MKNANPVSRRWVSLLAWWGGLLLAGCGGEAAKGPPKTVSDWFVIQVGAVEVDMQLAVRLPEMQHGLMGRKELGERQGMLFVYRSPQQLSFWMRNTSLPLDIGYFTSDGTLREVYQLHPYDETPVGSMRDDLQYALELNQGAFARLGIKPGDKLDLDALRVAVKARGFDLRQFAGLVE